MFLELEGDRRRPVDFFLKVDESHATKIRVLGSHLFEHGGEVERRHLGSRFELDEQGKIQRRIDVTRGVERPDDTDEIKLAFLAFSPMFLA
jgi:hypothetical protein